MTGGPWVQEFDAIPDPADCCERLAGLPCRLFLDSALRSSRLGRYSFLTADPVGVIRSKGARAEYLDRLTNTSTRINDPIDAVRDLLNRHRCDPIDDLPPFQGGAAGFVAYEWGRTLERIPLPRYDDLALPDLVLGIYDWVLAWDHERSRAWLISTGLPDVEPASRAARARLRAKEVLERLSRPSSDAVDLVPAMSMPRPPSAAPAFAVSGEWWNPALGIRSSLTRDAYLAAVDRVRDYIYAGDIFQANLSQRFEAPLTDAPWAFYLRLRSQNAAPFAAFLDLPDAVIASASPERFLSVDAGGRVETRPIKGTRPRGTSPEEDARLARALTESTKDQAENLMIVDVMRNDLSRVCRPGTVDVPELFTLERYATVHHLVSAVVGQLASGEDALSLLQATFPGGSITGAPKIRAMEIIAELEPSARGVYCGCIGFWSVTGAMDSSIAIRTAVVRQGKAFFSAGGGIVAASDATQEYRETLDKARGIIDALAPHGSAHR